MVNRAEVASEALEAADLLRLVEYLLEVAENRPDGEISLPLSGIRVALKQSREIMSRIGDELGSHLEEEMPQARSRASVSSGSIADRVQPVPGVASPRARELVGKGNSTGGFRQ